MRSSRSKVLGVTSAIALAVSITTAGLIGASHQAASRFGANSASFDPLNGAVSLRDIHLRFGDGAVRIGSLSYHSQFGLIGAAHAAENFSMKDVSVDGGGLTWRADTIDIVGSTVAQKDIAAFLEKKNTKTFAELLAGLGASSISIPNARIEYPPSSGGRVIVLTKLDLRNIAAGKAGALSAAGGSLEGPAAARGTFGSIAGTSVDLAEIATLVNTTQTPSVEAKPLYGSLAVEKLSFTSNANSITAGRIRSADVKIGGKDQTPRTLPALGTFAADDLTIEVTGGAKPAKWTAKGISMSADTPKDNIPTRFRANIDTLVLNVPPADPAYKNLVDLGYSVLAFSVVAEGDWLPAANEFTIKTVSLRGEDIGNITLSGQLGKVTRDVFNLDPMVARPAANAATVKSLSLTIENKGLFERLVAREAKKKNQPIDVTRREVAAASTVALASMTATTPDAKAFQTAMVKFLSNPKTLRVNLKSKDPAGILFTALGDKEANKKMFDEKIDVTVAAD